jgi:hypothetical protein
MARAELRTRVVLGQKDLGMIHTSPPAPHNKLLRTIVFESDRSTELPRPAGDAATGSERGIFSMLYGVIDRVGASKPRPYIP